MSAVEFSIESRQQCCEMRGIGIPVAPLTLCQTRTKSNKQIKLEGEIRILKRRQEKRKENNKLGQFFYTCVGKERDKRSALTHIAVFRQSSAYDFY
jgi:hypothetical protein